MSLTSEDCFKLTLTTMKSVSVTTYQGQRFLSFSETFAKDGKCGTKFINLNKDEWFQLRAQLDVIARMLDRKVMTLLNDDRWTFTSHDDSDVYCFADDFTKKDVLLHLRAYLVRMYIERKVRLACAGCQGGCVDKDGNVLDNHSCKLPFSKHLEAMFVEASDAIQDFGLAVYTINDCLKWNISSTVEFTDDEVKQLLETQIENTHEEPRSVACVLRNTFDILGILNAN